jgi:N-acetylmuramoyl-L-alanine amidase
VIILVLLGIVYGVQHLTTPANRLASDKSTMATTTTTPKIRPLPVSDPALAIGSLDPAVFAPGSCVALAPTHGDRHQTVFLDAGHGGPDPGAVGETESGATIYEKNITLPVELDTAALLRADGYRVVVSRTTGGPVAIIGPGDISEGVYTDAGAHREVAERDVCANLAKASVLIGIYFDAGASSENAGSITAYDPDRPFAAANLRLAKLLQKTVLGDMNAQGWQIPNGGVNSSVFEGGPALTEAAAEYDHLLLLGPAKAGFFSTPSEMPGAVIEPLFITDPFEGSIAASANGQHIIAGGIAATVEGFLGGGGA